MAPREKLISAVSRKGVNFVRDVVESANCIFHEIAQENDFGNDAFIELVDGENVRGITLAVQIKSGKSFIHGNKCKIPATRDKFQYWAGHSLTVVGIVYDPSESAAYWFDISRYLKNNPEVLDQGPFTLSFDKKEIGRFTPDGFRDFFLPIFLNKPVRMPLGRARRFAADKDYDLHSCGIRCLMRQYARRADTWALFFRLFRERPPAQIDKILIYYLAHIPGHPDIFFWGETARLPKPLIAELKCEIAIFTHADVLKLINLMDEVWDFERASLGQNVEALVSLVDNKMEILLDIVRDATVAGTTRANAAIMYAYYVQADGISTLEEISKECPSVEGVPELLKQLRTEGFVYLY